MPKKSILIIGLLAFCFIAKGQVRDTVNNASRISKDTFNMQDTTNIPHGK
jgi:hypothetical protein